MTARTRQASGSSILILANGDWTGASSLRQSVAEATHIIATDGAWTQAKSRGIVVDEVIGDLDSLSPEGAAQAQEETRVLAYPTEKDWTDLELAIDLALTYAPDRLLIYGAIGDRLDHSLAALFLLQKAADRKVSAALVAGPQTVWHVADRLELSHARVGDRVSLLPVAEEAVVRTQGLQYVLDGERLLRAASRGISNVVEHPPAGIAVLSGRLLVIHTSLGSPA